MCLKGNAHEKFSPNNSPKARTNAAITVARGTSAVVKAAVAGHRLKNNLVSEIAVREIVIVALACCLIGITAAALIVQFVP